jgi:hypothetical protein
MSRSGSSRIIIPSTTLAYMATVPCTGAVPSRPPARQPAPPCLDAGSIRCVAAGDTARCGEWHVRWRALLRGRRRLGRGRGWSRAWVGRGQSQKWSAARAAQRTGASSRCGAQYGEFALRPARALSLASRLRWLLKSFLSLRFSCFSSKRPNSAAMTDLGGFPALPFGFGLAVPVVSQFGARDGLRPKENAESNVFSHTTQTQTLRSPQLPRWQGDASPDGVRWWGPATQL